MLSEYRGPSNSPEIFQHLVGEKIVAAFRDNDGQFYIAVESGDALTVTSNGSYWKVDRSTLERIVQNRKATIERQLAELRDMAGIPL